MIYLLDTNVCIRYLNGSSEPIRKIMELKKPEEIVICSVVKAELNYGAVKSRNPIKNLNKLKIFLDRFVSLSFDDKASEIYGEIRAKLEKSGMLIGPNDLLITATAMANEVTLVSHNTREFSRIDGLKLEDREI